MNVVSRLLDPPVISQKEKGVRNDHLEEMQRAGMHSIIISSTSGDIINQPLHNFDTKL